MGIETTIEPTVACAGLDVNIVNQWDCIFQSAFFNDPILITLFFLFFLGYAGLKMNLPASVMFLFGFGILFLFDSQFNVPYLFPILTIGFFLVVVNLVITYFKGAKNATQ